MEPARNETDEKGMQRMERETSMRRPDREDFHKTSRAISALDSQAESLAQVAHDARNMAMALDVYCDLLKEPGVLATPFSHYGGELKHVAATSRALVEKLAALSAADAFRSDAGPVQPKGHLTASATGTERRDHRAHRAQPRPIENFAAEVLVNRNVLTAIAGPTIALTIDVEGSALPVRLAGEDLTRILVNLVKNSAEAMCSVGRVHVTLWEGAGDSHGVSWLTLNVEDNGPGFPDRMLAHIFEQGAQYSLATLRGELPAPQRGLGLAITRSLVEAAGGRIQVANRDPVGACVQIELPVRHLAMPIRCSPEDCASFN
jgi:signal transduction histidine kinase